MSRDREVAAACLDTLRLRRVAVPGDIDQVATRLAVELAGRVPPDAVALAVRHATCDLSGIPATAWPELVERSARQRLL